MIAHQRRTPLEIKSQLKVFCIASSVYKKWESLSTPDTLTTTKAGMKATTTTIQRPVSVSERSLGFKRYRYSNLSQFDNLYVELAKLWLYLKSEPVCLFSDPIFVHLSPSPLSERTNFLSQPRVFMIYILAHPLGCSICVEIFHVNCVSENFAQLQHALGSRLPGHKLTQPCLWPWLSC